MFCFFPETDSEHGISAGREKRNLVQEPVLLAKFGNHLLFHQKAELRNASRLQLHGHFACEHGVLPGFWPREYFRRVATGREDLKAALIHVYLALLHRFCQPDWLPSTRALLLYLSQGGARGRSLGHQTKARGIG